MPLPRLHSAALLALKGLVLALLVLWYGMLPVPLMEDAARAAQFREGRAFALLTAASTIFLSGLMASLLLRRAWLGLTFAAAVYVLIEFGRQHVGLGEIALMCAVFALWAGLATGVAVLWRRWVAPRLLRRQSLQAVAAGAAALATGMVVLLHPQLLAVLIGVFHAANGLGAPVSADAELALYYVLGGLAAGFTLRLLWPRARSLPAAWVATLTVLWCALAASTLLDTQDSMPWIHPGAATPPAMGWLLLAIAGSVLAGLWLARWPSTWSRDA